MLGCQVAGTEGLLEWSDFCVPFTELECEYTLKGSGFFVDGYTRVGQEVEVKKVSGDPASRRRA